MSGYLIDLEDERILRSYDRIGRAIVEYISDMDLAWEIEMARRVYFGNCLNIMSQRILNSNYRPFIQWLIFSYKLYSSGSSLIDSISGYYAKNIGNGEKDTIHSLKDTYESFYKVYSISDDKISAKDIFTGEEVIISDSILKYKIKRYCGLFTRIAHIRNKNILIPGYCIMSNSFLKETQNYIMVKYNDYKKINNNISIRDFIKSNSLIIHRYLLRYQL